MTKRRPIHQCDRSLPKDDVVDELRELVIPATDGHIFCHGRQIRIWWIRIINVFPDVIPWLVETPIEVAQNDEVVRPRRRLVDPVLKDRYLAGKLGACLPA